MSKGTIALDFDGVLHSYTSGWTGPVPTDPPTLNAQAFVVELLHRGYEVAIFSTRCETPEGLQGVKDWLVIHGFSPKIQVSVGKPKAKLYVDDRGFRFGGKFHEVLSFMDDNPTLEPWNREIEE